MKEYVHHCNVCGLDFEDTEANPKVCALCDAPMAATKLKVVKSGAKKKRKRVMKIAKIAVATPPEFVESESSPSEPPPSKSPPSREPQTPKVRRRPTSHAIMLALSGAGTVIGAAGTVLYVFTQNMAIGAPALIAGVAGIIAFKYYWDKGGEIATEIHGEINKQQVDCLDIYRDVIVFENWPGKEAKPGGYIWRCLNDKKPYWVNFHDQTKAMAGTLQLKPFVLPDQQYYDPTVFAERVLELPAHRRIFKRREKLGQTIKTALLVVAMGILFFLILVTTPTGG